MDTDERNRIAGALLALRLGVFVVMLMWTLDKLLNVPHAARIFAGFYGLSVPPLLLYIIGGAELILILAFVAGYKKRVTYGLVFAFHAISTLSSYRQYLDPWNNLLFFAAWPMLAACYALYLLRDLDTMWAVETQVSDVRPASAAAHTAR